MLQPTIKNLKYMYNVSIKHFKNLDQEYTYIYL